MSDIDEYDVGEVVNSAVCISKVSTGKTYTDEEGKLRSKYNYTWKQVYLPSDYDATPKNKNKNKETTRRMRQKSK